MRAPDFWDEAPGLVAGLLSPLSAALDAAGRLRRAVARPYRAPVPVICVGNLVAGGSGKTPVVLSLAAVLARRGVDAQIVMRGYGGRLAGPVRVDPEHHHAADIGDEALLAAAAGVTCWVARDRAAGVRAAANAGAQAILLDDGFQNPSVAKDLSLIVVDGAYGFGNGRLLPAGPLRERVADGLERADAVVLLDEPAPTELTGFTGSVLRATLEPIDGGRFAGARVAAFAGIGRPEKFFATLRRLGAIIVAEHPFPDHHPFRGDEIGALRRQAERDNARLVTTAKDAARLRPEARDGIDILEIQIRWRDETALTAVLAPVLQACGAAAD
jgi:tetraacyldisaccharide 4'-kinase